ncbi:hypothetical protein DE146DRAFT_626531 [Phaeosphaeria sp. MPI-PUGE-AT-0046c]|nr:hypothetical protein DE146DRAFT_626531 [Phaeosphaeria sp. MPI-PUGE-AT-0046c]
MRLKHILLSVSATCVSTVTAQDTFEPPDFNVTQALIDNGVKVSDLSVPTARAARSLATHCSEACGSLKSIFGNSKVSSAPPDTYWSLQQSSVRPTCTFNPTTAKDVSTAVLIMRLFQCQFAAKSGGHAAFAGASSIEGGITLDFVNMKERELSTDRKTVAIGPGNRWLDVYDFLTPYGLAVVGGRAASVGVSGLTLGGGISHHTNKYGLACDNIASYDIVTASGRIINVSENSHPDLYWALRGGGNNFGIVTTFHYETLEQGLMFASKRQYNATHIPALIDAFGKAVESADSDTHLAHFVSVAYAGGVKIASTEFEYFTPVDVSNPPEILQEYLSIPPLQHTTQNVTLAETTPGLTESMPAGFRTTMWSQSFRLNVKLMKRMSDHFYEIAPNVPGIASSIAFQAFSEPALRAMQKKGGNALGLDTVNGPLFHALFYVPWTDEKDDRVILKAAQDYMSAAVAMAKELGAYNDYMYMPYSSPYQSVIKSYGAANQARLATIARKYDPSKVFQVLQPGYFKLGDHAPYGPSVL